MRTWPDAAGDKIKAPDFSLDEHVTFQKIKFKKITKMFIVIITVYKIIDDFYFVYAFLYFLNVLNVSKIRIN